MFYFIIGAIVVGYLFYTGLSKLQAKPLRISCPCTFVAATAVATALFTTDHKLLAWIVLLFGIYLLGITLMALRKVTHQKLDVAGKMVN